MSEEIPPEARLDAWTAGGPPLWFTQTTDKTTGERSLGHYLVTYTGTDQARSYHQLKSWLGMKYSLALDVEQVRRNIIAYFDKLYRGNPNYRTHDLDIKVYGPFKTTEAEARRLVFGK